MKMAIADRFIASTLSHHLMLGLLVLLGIPVAGGAQTDDGTKPRVRPQSPVEELASFRLKRRFEFVCGTGGRRTRSVQPVAFSPAGCRAAVCSLPK